MKKHSAYVEVFQNFYARSREVFQQMAFLSLAHLSLGTKKIPSHGGDLFFDRLYLQCLAIL